MIAPGLVSRDRTYPDRGHTVVRGLVERPVVEHLVAYAGVLAGSGRLEVDTQVPGSLRRYGAPGFEALLASCAPALSAAVGLELLPTYSFVRLYRRGQDLAAHRDRSACEHSATVHLASAPEGHRWPIGLRLADGPATEVELAPGDAVIYAGTQALHWREPLDAEWYLQVFLHYVDAGGPHAHHALDGRAHLGAAR